MANVKFERGLEDDVTTEIPTDGHLYVGTDTGNMYLGKSDGTKLPIGQSDWNQTDDTKSDFIKNKPDIPKEKVYHDGDNVSIRQLPTQGYTRLKTAYNSNNSTYISTGVSLLNTEEIELEIRFRPQNQSTVIPRLLGRTGGTRPLYWFGLFSTTKSTNYDPPSAYTFKMFVRDNDDGYLDSGVIPVKGHTYLVRGTLKSNNATLYVLDETTGEDTFVTGTFSPYFSDINIWLFPNTYNSTNYMASNTEVFHAVIRKNGEKRIEYIPFKRNSDDAVGFINTVNGDFVEATQGQFNVGATAAIEDYVVSVPDIPTDTSDLTNGAGFITSADLPAPYTAGNGIAINSNNEISAKVSEWNGLGFGANGDIALSLVQNSANGAMASDDFRKLYDNVEMVHLLGTEYQLNNWYINSNNNNYVASTTYKSYLIPVSSIGKVSIYDSATTTYYSFLKPYEEGGSSNVPGSTDYAYATGYTGRKTVAQGTTEVVSVPSDATWLWVYSGQNKAYDPTSLKFTGIAIGIADGIPSPASTPPLMDGAASAGTSTDYARADHVHPSDTSRVPTTRKVNNKALSADITLTAADVGALPSDTVIPTVGTLNTDNTSAQSVNASESLGGTVKLHKVAKTGTYGDLLGIPTIPDINTALYKGVYTNSAVSEGQGLLVKTTLKANTSVFPMFHIIGRHHGGGKLIDTYVTFYNYISDNSSMNAPSVLHCGRDIGEIHAFVYNPDDTTSPTTGYIYIWIPTVLRFNTYHVYCRLYNSETNHVDTITKAAMFDETLVARHSVITPYVSAMTTDVPDNANLVHLTGNETIAGTKTFTGAVVVPAPTANTHAATKKYIDDIVGDIETLLASI